MRLIAQDAKSDRRQLVSDATEDLFFGINSPPLVVLALGVCLEVVVALKPFGAFRAVELA